MESLDRGRVWALRGWADQDRVPTDLALVYDFANTLDERTFGDYSPFEAFVDPQALTRWLARRRLVPPGDQADVADLGLALELRSALRAAARAQLEGTVDAQTATGFAGLADRLPLLASLDNNGQLGLRPAASGVRRALGQILAEAVTAASQGEFARVKMCSAPDCRWVFYDHCKPRTGRWCSTSGCGNRIKTRNYRARAAAGL